MLDELLADPTQIDTLTPKEACRVFVSCSALLTALAARAWQNGTRAAPRASGIGTSAVDVQGRRSPGHSGEPSS
jgi:hypothetical protein